MLKCDGYKMVAGVGEIHTVSGQVIRIEGTWLFRPDTGCWYVQPTSGGFARSIPADILVSIDGEEV